MIPLRIAVKGFLSYRDEQEICFENASLWMLAGLNGSGKSAVFDGVTYALFGGHRAGKEHVEELINKNCDSAFIEFDFLLDNQRFRARRTLRRKKQGGTQPTQQISRWRPAEGNEPGRWAAILDTSQKRNFDAWVRENIGLTYETFTSSVLLMQGKAEKLLAAAPKDRFEVLAGIVDLERYQHLHERAEEKRRHYKELVELLQHRLDELPEVTAAEIEQADREVVAARSALEAARSEVERHQRLEFQAQRWQELQDRLPDARKQSERAESLLEASGAIEWAASRLRELCDVLPHMNAIVEQRERLTRSHRMSATVIDEQRQMAERLGEVTFAVEQTRHKQHLLQQSIARDQQRAEIIGIRLRELSGWLARVDLCDQQRQEIARIETALARLPADPSLAVMQAQNEHDRLMVLAQALPSLSRLANVRQELGRLQRHHASLVADETKATAEMAEMNERAAHLGAELEESANARQQADERATEARTLLDQARQQLQHLNELSGSKVCRLCGQALTPNHVAEERIRREKIRGDAETKAQAMEAVRVEAVEALKKARLVKEQADAARLMACDRIKECQRQLTQNERERRRLIVEGVQVYQELPESFRREVSADGPEGWLHTAYPSDNELSSSRAEVLRRPQIALELQQAQKVLEDWRQLRAQSEAIRQFLKANEEGLPPEPEVLRQEHRQLDAEDTILKSTLKANRDQLEWEQQTLNRLQHDQKVVGEQLVDKAQQWSAEEARREEYQKSLERALAALPAAWQPAARTVTIDDVQRWQAEQAELERQRVPARMQELVQARANAALLRHRLEELEQESDRIPVEARSGREQLQVQRQRARQDQAQREAELLHWQRTQERLSERQAKRQQLQQEHAEQDRRHHRYRLLAELLGRNRLQLYLVRQAERGIVDYANAILDRLSGGQLYLRLRGEESLDTGADQALQLEAYNRTAGAAPIGVAFLSGSQRFRVAVSMALGIGQYASRQHRPIESVIIDEGFGCLDRQGRQVMIQELQNLRGHLRCILLVSHQEEFAEAFADTYRFELNDGATRVQRLQR